MKKLSTKRAKSTQISTKTKKAVYERDNGLCVVCGRVGTPNAHYIPRSKGGLGTEKNIVCLCLGCHNKFDFGDAEEMTEIGEKIKAYLQSKYPDWDEDDLVYKKYGGMI